MFPRAFPLRVDDSGVAYAGLAYLKAQVALPFCVGQVSYARADRFCSRRLEYWHFIDPDALEDCETLSLKTKYDPHSCQKRLSRK